MKSIVRGISGVVVLAIAAFAPLAGQEMVYVAIQGEAKVSVVDAHTLEEVERIDLTALGFSENAKPHHIAVDPDGSHWYVSLIGENRILKFDRRNELVGEVEFQVPGLLVRAPDTDRLYVGRSMSAVNPPRSIGEVDTRTMQVEEIDVFFPRPHALALAPTLGRIYSASLAQNQLASIDAKSFEMELLNLDGPVHTVVQFAVSPDGATLVGTTEMTGRLLIFDLADPAAPVLRASVPVGARPWHPVFAPDGHTVWFAVKGDDAVVAVDVDRGEVVHRIEAASLAAPHGAEIVDGRLFVTSNGPSGMQMGEMSMGGAAATESMHDAMGHGGKRPTTGTLTVIDLATLEVIGVLEMGENTTGIGARR
ncbi:MAG: hypothetical protein RQ745_11705 [Longimicrobiales bacterium]|nr:hypothetical protein [Longimicrobiales bacterium]